MVMGMSAFQIAIDYSDTVGSSAKAAEELRVIFAPWAVALASAGDNLGPGVALSSAAGTESPFLLEKDQPENEVAFVHGIKRLHRPRDTKDWIGRRSPQPQQPLRGS